MPISKHNSLLYLKLAIPVFFLFAIVYGGTNWFSSTREEYYHIYFNWELSIPFVAEMIIIYLSIQLIFILPIFHCQETNMYILAKRMSLATILAGIIFILLPTHSGFPGHDELSVFRPVFTMLHQLDRPHNLFPSMHITLSTLVITMVISELNNTLRIIYLFWLALLYLSVLLVHQHHVADIFGGLILAVICIRLVPAIRDNQI